MCPRMGNGKGEVEREEFGRGKGKGQEYSREGRWEECGKK